MRTGLEYVQRFLQLEQHDNELASQLLFFIPLAVWLFFRILIYSSAYSTTIVQYVSFIDIEHLCYFLLVLREVLFGKWNRWAFLGLVAFFVLGLISFTSDYIEVFDGLIFIFAARNIPFKRIMAFMFATLGVVFVFVVISCLVGVIPDLTFNRADGRIRHSLGFGYPNTVGCYVFALLCAWVCYRNERFNLADLIIAGIVAGVVYFLTDSRAALVVSVFLIAACFIARLIPKRILDHKLFCVLLSCFAIAIPITFFILIVNYDSNVGWMSALNDMLSGRLTLGHQGFEIASISWTDLHGTVSANYDYDATTGQRHDNSLKIVVDCAYMFAPLRLGGVFCAIAYFFLIAVFLRTVSCKEYWQAFAIIAMLLYGVSEKVVLWFYFDPMLFLIGGLFASRLCEKQITKQYIRGAHSRASQHV